MYFKIKLQGSIALSIVELTSDEICQGCGRGVWWWMIVIFIAGETDTPNETTVSAVVSEQPEESERVPESDDDFSNPSLGSSLLIRIMFRAVYNEPVNNAFFWFLDGENSLDLRML